MNLISESPEWVSVAFGVRCCVFNLSLQINIIIFGSFLSFLPCVEEVGTPRWQVAVTHCLANQPDRRKAAWFGIEEIPTRYIFIDTGKLLKTHILDVVKSVHCLMVLCRDRRVVYLSCDNWLDSVSEIEHSVDRLILHWLVIQSAALIDLIYFSSLVAEVFTKMGASHHEVSLFIIKIVDNMINPDIKSVGDCKRGTNHSFFWKEHFNAPISHPNFAKPVIYPMIENWLHVQ